MSADDVTNRFPAWFAAWAERSPVGVAVFDDALRYVALNEALARMNGIPREATSGVRCRSCSPAPRPTSSRCCAR